METRQCPAFLWKALLLLHVHVVNNFQNITEELNRKQASLEQNKELARMKEELNVELVQHDAKLTNTRYTTCYKLC